MMDEGRLQKWCSNLEVSGIRVRKEAVTELSEHLRQRSVLDFMKDSRIDWWPKLSQAIFSCMLRDHEKQLEETRRKGEGPTRAPPSADLFSLFVRTAVKENSSLNFLHLIQAIVEWLDDGAKKMFHHTFLKLLSECLLLNVKIGSLLEDKDWRGLFRVLKSLCTDFISDSEQLKCLAVLMKIAPLHKFPVGLYRQQFNSMARLSQIVTSKSPKPQQEAIVDLIFNFCKNTAKDNRMMCCRLGEDIFRNFVDLYQNNEDAMKANLIKFFLFQVTIHNPKGVTVGNPVAYSASRDIWHDSLCTIYDILVFEIDANLKRTRKNEAFFVRKKGVHELFDSFVQLFVEVSRQLFTVGNTSIEEPPTKRRRTEFGVTNLIRKIQETKSWPWLNLTYSLLETYPDLATRSDYLEILKILTSLQAETKETNFLHHVHKALIILLRIESLTDVEKNDVDSSWRSVSDATLRLNNQNDENIQTLLQLLIVNRYLTSHDALIQYYRPGGAVGVDAHNLKTIDVAFKNFTSLQIDRNVKKQTISWIVSNAQEFKFHQVAEILVCLTMKQWPRRKFEFSEVRKPFEDFEDVYFSTCFRNLLVDEDTEKGRGEEEEIFCVDQSVLDHLTELLHDVTDDTIILVFNVLSYLYEYKLISDANFSLFGVFQTSLVPFFQSLNLGQLEPSERQLALLTQNVERLCRLFSGNINDFMGRKIREYFTDSMIRDLFRHLSFQGVVPNDQILKLQKAVIPTLVNFSLLPTSRSTTQDRAFLAVVSANYDCSEDHEYEVVLTLLDSIKSCAPENLTENSLLAIFDILQQFCEVHYYSSDSVAIILDFFYVVYPMVVTSQSIECKNSYIAILYPLYCARKSYEPSISVRLLKCMSLVFQLEPSATYTRWSNEDIVNRIPEFLCSDYQQVRFAAIRALATIFRTSSKMPILEQYHKQEILFSKIAEMSVRVLEVEGTVNDARIMDETVSRTSSIFHTFAAIMVASNLWIEEALFSLLKIVCDKNLGLSQLEMIIEMTALKLGFESGLKFLEKYLIGIVDRWGAQENFPFSVFQCRSKVDLYSKYWPLLAHIFLIDSNNEVNEIAAILKKSPTQLIEDTSPRLFSHCIGQEASDLTLFKNNRIYKVLQGTLDSGKLREICKNNIEEMILCLVQFVCDEKAYEANFQRNIIFPKITQIRLTVDDFRDCLQFLEDSLYDGASVVSTLMHCNPEKIHFILLQLNLQVNGVKALEDKLRCFHLYSIMASMCVDSVIAESSMQTYLIRDLTHTLLHNIKNHKRQPELSEISCLFFKTVLGKILPALAETVKEFFLVIISRLKYVALEDCIVSKACVEMLELLIVTHQDLFVSEISKLDSVPNTKNFEKIYTVHLTVKYDRKVTLEDEIIQFLDFSKNIESLDECEHSITHLKSLLTSKKDELKVMYTDLRKTRGLSEDCESSILHKLICMLIILSSSSNKNVSMEAARCLGEIGPADLATLILQPEKSIPNPKWTPWELVLGCAISLLSKYLIDADVKVIKTASFALFQILRTKEGRKVGKSENDFGFGVVNANYLTPFCMMDLRLGAFRTTVNGDLFMKLIQNDALWVPDDECHDTWIKRLVCSFLEAFEERQFFKSFIEVCKLKIEFCEQILPLIVYIVLFLNNVSLTGVISEQIEIFFNKHWDITVNNRPSVSITTNKSSVQTMLNVVHFVRLQKSARKKEIRALQLDYLRVAKAAHFCTAHFTALLYADQWCQEQIDQSPTDYALSTCSYTKLDLIYEKVDDVTGNALQSILRQAYKSVGERDALLGCGTSHLLSPASRVDHYKELGRWDLVTQYYERQVSLGRREVLPSLVDSLKSANLYQLSLFCSQSCEDANYESLWRLAQWGDGRSDLSRSYDKAKFDLLKSLHDKESFGFAKALDEGRSSVVAEFASANMESSKNFYHTFAKLQCLTEIEDFREASGSDKMADLLVKWKTQDDIVCNDHQYVEAMQAQRILLLTDVLKTHERAPGLADLIVDNMIGYAQCARIEGNSQVAFRILENLRLLPNSSEFDAKIKLEEAQLCWTIQDVVSAKCILRQLCGGEAANPRVHAMALKMMGQWMVESSSENRQTIIDNYFQKSLNLIKGDRDFRPEDERSVAETFEQLAKFADREYQEVMSHIKSDIFQKKKKNMRKSMELVSSIPAKKQTDDLRRALMIKRKLSRIDEVEIGNIETDKDNLLLLALKYYFRILIRSDEYNMTIFRVFSLLLENRSNEIVQKFLEQHLLRIPTYKFIDILPQIIPHISNTSSDIFTQTVNNLIEKCARDHPYHTLPLVLSLALSNKDRDYSESKAVSNDARTQSARSILRRLRSAKKLSDLIEKMELVSEAVIELAYWSNGGGDKLKVPRNAKIRKIRNFDDVLLPTHTLPVSKSCDYERIVGIEGFGEVYYNVGGINAPKRITCQGTDGLTRTQLIKGQDDIRQDAVMQQVFTIMNGLLGLNKQTKNLKIRTYKIVPLSMRSGILEWVDNTTPINEYLSGGRGDGGAHAKFRPQDATPLKCRVEFKNSASCKTNEERLGAFNSICEKIKPVFHKFFETTFPQPTVWYERRRTYIHSVAASSMCGYILGIGDRHLNNILIDMNTAEVVHIDFGIAFEQGRVLPTPETVPFRLTRDIVDGMGVSGVEGVFRRSCEKTVEVLRLHYQTIITILEVLLYDPLYDWTVSSAEANKRQKDEQDDGEYHVSQGGGSDEDASKDVNETAERALLRLRAKLQGTESGKATTVEHQVGTLIQQAVDPSNLCRLFYGWQPYL